MNSPKVKKSPGERHIIVSESSSYKIQGILIKGKPYVSIRQFYRTKKDPKWKPSRSGMTVPLELAPFITKNIRRIVDTDLEHFQEIQPDE